MEGNAALVENRVEWVHFLDAPPWSKGKYHQKSSEIQKQKHTTTNNLLIIKNPILFKSLLYTN